MRLGELEEAVAWAVIAKLSKTEEERVAEQDERYRTMGVDLAARRG